MGRSRELAELASAYDGSSLGFRNRIINGDMRIDQRNAGASVTISSNVFVVDRWQADVGGLNSYTGQRSTTAPAGFTNSLAFTMGTGSTIDPGDYAFFREVIEGFNVADLGLGTANAVPFTLSFWVRSSVTGTFGVSFRNGSANATYCSTYTINAANTWEYKTVTVPAITSGTWLTDNGAGLGVFWDLGVGSTYSGTAGQLNTGANYFGVTGTTKLAATTGATFYITGVQLEAGSVATPFERRPYGTELQLCQRYYERITSLLGNGPSFPCFMNSTVVVDAMVHWLVQKRATPTISGSTGTNHFGCEIGNAGFAMNAFLGSYQTSQYGARCRFQFNSGTSTVALAGYVTIQNTSAYIDASSEL